MKARSSVILTLLFAATSIASASASGDLCDLIAKKTAKLAADEANYREQEAAIHEILTRLENSKRASKTAKWIGIPAATLGVAVGGTHGVAFFLERMMDAWEGGLGRNKGLFAWFVGGSAVAVGSSLWIYFSAEKVSELKDTLAIQKDTLEAAFRSLIEDREELETMKRAANCD